MFGKILPVLLLGASMLGGCNDLENQSVEIANPAIDAVRRLSNGVEMPLLGFGTWQMTGEAGYQGFMTAIAAGYRHIDTAAVYRNEVEVGRAIRDSGIPRSEFFIVSKVEIQAKSYDAAMASFEQTLADLGTDYVDQYLIHWPVTRNFLRRMSGDIYHAENREVWRALEDIYIAGRARSIGVSNFSINDLRNIMEVARIMPHANQVKYHIGHTPNDLKRFGERHGIALVGYSTLGRGRVLQSPTVQMIAARNGVTPAQLSIRYSLQRGVIPLVKSANAGRQLENIAVDFIIPESDMRILDEMEIPTDNW